MQAIFGKASFQVLVVAVILLFSIPESKGFVHSAPTDFFNKVLRRQNHDRQQQQQQQQQQQPINPQQLDQQENRRPQLWMAKSDNANAATPAAGATDNDDDENDDESTTTLSPKNLIVISSDIKLPFSATVAYDAFSDLTRQPLWSPWLRSVEYISPNETVWKMRRFLGLSYSWRAVSTQMERPRLIAWESTKGLKNYGRVEFTKLNHKNLDPSSSSNNNNEESTHMKVSLSVVVPRVVCRLMGGENSRVARFVELRMVQKSLRHFRDIVMEEQGIRSSSSSSRTTKNAGTPSQPDPEKSLVL